VKLIDAYRSYVHPTNIGRSVKKLLKLSLDPAVYAKDLISVFEENPALVGAVLKWETLQSKLKEWVDEDPLKRVDERVLLVRSLNLLGKQSVRNLVASQEILRIQGALPKKQKEKFRLNPKDLIPYALSAEEKSELSPGVLPEVAFLAGYHFDLLKAALIRAKAPREGIAAMEREWGEWLKDAQFSVRLASQLKKFEEGGLVYSGALLSQIGSVLMRTIHPSELEAKSYREFLKTDLGKPPVDLNRLLTEKKRFEILEREWSSIFIREVGLFPELERMVRYFEEQYFFFDGKEIVLSDVLSDALLNRKEKRARRRMSISEDLYESIRKKSI
jgi:HD-like signal output (HDOD) protein